MGAEEQNQVQCFGRKKNATAVAHVCSGAGYIRVNGKALELLEPATMRMKFNELNIRVRVRGGGPTTQVMAIRQAICKGVISYNQKFGDESEKRELKELLIQYDKSLLVADPRRCEPKKFGGKGARARFQKSYR